MGETLSRYDTADYLKTEEDIAAYLEACAEESDAEVLAHVLAVIARARNMIEKAAAEEFQP